jgi:hypothetical protein
LPGALKYLDGIVIETEHKQADDAQPVIVNPAHNAFDVRRLPLGLAAQIGAIIRVDGLTLLQQFVLYQLSDTFCGRNQLRQAVRTVFTEPTIEMPACSRAFRRCPGAQSCSPEWVARACGSFQTTLGLA